MDSQLSTVYPEEIERFNKLAATWWNPNGPMWPLHKLNELRAPFVLSCLQQHLPLEDNLAAPLQGLTVLDVGCGAGLLSEAMARFGAHVTGIDPAQSNIAIARQHAEEQGLKIDYQQCTVDALPPGQFDVVLNMEVVEHVAQLPDFMATCCERVAAGGVQFVATINRNPLSFLVAIVGAEYILRWLPRGTHQWRAFVKPAEITEMLNTGELEVKVKKGVSVNPITRHYALTDSDTVNYMIMGKKHGSRLVTASADPDA